MNNAAKTVPRILRDNICTGFNALNLMIALVLAAVGAWRNLLFIFIILNQHHRRHCAGDPRQAAD